MRKQRKIKIFTGSANPELAEAVAKRLGMPLGRISLSRFSDGELFVRIGENVRGDDVYIIQPTCAPVNERLMELAIMLDAFRRASAGKVNAVIPYFGYARQDRKKEPRTPITAKLAANLITVSGADRVITIDLHSGQTQAFFDIPEDNLYARPVLLGHLMKRKHRNLVIVSPDAGGTDRARSYASRAKCGLAIIDKRREFPNKAEVMHVVGNVDGMHAVLVDDMIDTAGTVIAATQALLDNGALSVDALATHGVLSGPAIERIQGSRLRSVIVTDTIPLSPAAEACGKIKVVSIADLLAKAIRRINGNKSVSDLF